ncbi:MAG TPA: FecR family protein [Enhygromyxa sp.]|nr:FecR family protein [Enhygromyxa sp.]
MTEREEMLELDACLARVPMPAGLEARIVAATTLRSVGPSPVRRSLVVGLAFAAGVALTVLALRDWSPETADEASAAVEAPTPSLPEPSEVQRASVTPPAPGLTLTSEACAWSQSDDEFLRFEAGCRLRLAQPAMDIEIWTPTRLQPIDGGVAVVEGELMFVVEHVEDREHPARVDVSGGSIEVLGTRFAIRHASAGGHVDLLEGAIQFRRLDGEVEAIEPGQRYGWSDAIDEPAPQQPRPVVRPVMIDDAKAQLAEGLAEVARLRRAGALEAAIAKLDALAREQDEPRTLEVISYERGTLVERSASTSSACEHWSEHRRRFPGGRYDSEVERRIGQLECAR